MKVINTTKNTVLAGEARMADNFFSRLIGLLNRGSLNEGEALILSPSNSIHSFFMRFKIDAIFLDKQNRVIKTIISLKPWRFTKIYFNSAIVVELPSGAIQSTSTQEGDIISIL